MLMRCHISTLLSGQRALKVHGWPLPTFKTYWAKMKATNIAAKSPPRGKDHHTPELYFEDVLEGARLIEGQCPKDMIFE